MKKKIIFIIMLLIIIIPKVYANTINKIDMDIYINSDGTANIKETWSGYFNKGTEGYKTFSDIGNREIYDFYVSDEDGKEYEDVNNWRISASFNEKAYRSSIVRTNNGYELCFGISEYGNKTYYLNYKISDFITNYLDSQGVYFKLIKNSPDNSPISKVNIVIHANTKFNVENSKIWAFGYNGDINYKDGKIIIKNNGSLKGGEYVTLLVKFEDQFFNTNNTVNQTFNAVYDGAFHDVDKSELTSNNYYIKYDNEINILNILGKIILYVTIFLIAPILVITSAFKKDRYGAMIEEMNEKYPNRFDFGEEGRELPDIKEIDYYREFPFNKDLEKTYWICHFYKIGDEDTLRKGLIGALFLKWIDKGYITAIKDNSNNKEDSYILDFSKMKKADNDLEGTIFRLILLACKEDKKLSSDEFSKYCEECYNAIDIWFKGIIKKYEEEFTKEGLITKPTDMREIRMGVKKVNPKIKEYAKEVAGFKKFLEDFSSMHDKVHFDVKLWDEYLIYACLFGITDKVNEEFNRLYPEYKEAIKINTQVLVYTTKNIADVGYRSYTKGLEIAEKNKLIYMARPGIGSGSSSSFDRGTNIFDGSSNITGGGGSSFHSGGSSAGGSSGMGFR